MTSRSSSPDTSVPPPKLEGGFDERREVIVCVVNGCTFELPTSAEVPPEQTAGLDAALGLAPGSMALQAAHQHHRSVEQRLHDHLKSHNVLEWVKTVRSLQLALAQAQAPPDAVACSMCGRRRTPADPDYSPLQAAGRKLGWYSGDDGEICPEDLERTLRA